MPLRFDLCSWTGRQDVCQMECIWGKHKVARQEILLGVRFQLLDCPHALAWTITYHQERNLLVIHCTFDDRETSEQLVESIQKFVADWGVGLENVST